IPVTGSSNEEYQITKSKWKLELLENHFICDVRQVGADFPCICNYNVDTAVYKTPSTSGAPSGYLHKFDCKPDANINTQSDLFYVVQFRNQYGYIQKDNKIQKQTCPGSPSTGDIVTTTTNPHYHTTTVHEITTRRTTTTTTVPTTTTLKATTREYAYWKQSANVTGTPLQYIGVSYNLLTGNPEMAADPALLLDKRVLQTTLNAGQEVYQDHVTTCKMGTAQYDLAGVASNHYTVSHDFAKAVCILATLDSSSESQYLNFLDQWGTDPSVLDHSGYFKDHTSSLTISVGRYNQSALATHSFGSPDQLTVGSISNPKPIRIEVAPIFDFIQWNNFQPIMLELKARHECVETMHANDLQQIANNIRSVMAQYGRHKGATGTTDHPLQAPVTWPLGKFGVMKAASGCPGNDVHWLQGWRKHDTEDSGAHNSFTLGINNYLSGYFNTNDIKTDFCIKNTPSVTSYDTNWPKGSYCILKYGGSCPSGFQNGNDGRTSTAISLPTDRPFILVRLAATCQAVYGMGVTDVFVRWDDDDLFNNSGRGGMHPYDDGGSKDHMLHFCYYHSTAHMFLFSIHI
ncbi:hypothetical protein MAR_009715, partial [Mya arenaria]